ncbi:MAG: ribosomal protein L16 [Candidatus Xenolissoclinum pacificiensis L6]|uniref:50S ribosomal protein L16 n=1 Tax=Candidatus Xenolissoclinum pacificiensis L6 TaxID=1401685 RepID=W2V0Z1_9RICK|nr:MAG: ribosomal protein L16 [Candidatus Xenolissoclinum pacificiensis L6]
MLIPGKSKYKKQFKGRYRQQSSQGSVLSFGHYGMKVMGYARLNSRHIEAARKVITKRLPKSSRLWINIFPNLPVSKKPTDVRMGKGKGSVEEWVFRVSPGRIIFELSGCDEETARLVLLRASAKLPVSCRFTYLGEML